MGLPRFPATAFRLCIWTSMLLSAPTFRVLTYKAFWKPGQIKSLRDSYLMELTSERIHHCRFTSAKPCVSFKILVKCPERNRATPRFWLPRPSPMPPIRADSICPSRVFSLISRKHEVGRDCRTSDRGFPRRTVCGDEGIFAVSLNNAIGLRSANAALDDEQPKWKAPEVKPRIEDKPLNDSILLNASLMVFKEPINGFTDNFLNYFNQIPPAPAYYWTACFSL